VDLSRGDGVIFLEDQAELARTDDAAELARIFQDMLGGLIERREEHEEGSAILRAF
jgi:hypothetical protein